MLWSLKGSLLREDPVQGGLGCPAAFMSHIQAKFPRYFVSSQMVATSIFGLDLLENVYFSYNEKNKNLILDFH